MPKSRALSRIARCLPLACCVAALGVCAGGIARATTGPGYLLAAPKYSFPTKLLKAYSGRYGSSSVAPKSKIISAQLFIGLAESGYAAGGISIYSYDKQGQEQSFASALYDFRVVKAGVEASIVTSGGQDVIGRLIFHHVANTKNLAGQIYPPGGGGPYAISFHYGASAEPGNSSSSPGPPNPGVVSGPALTKTTRAPTAPGSVPGWGAAASFVGRYRVSPTATGGGQAGIFTLALRAARQLSSSQTSSHESLTLRISRSGGKLTPSGVLTLATAQGPLTVYLADLKSAGTTRAASIVASAGSHSPIGIFNGKLDGRGHLSAQVTIPGQVKGTLALNFTRYSTTP